MEDMARLALVEQDVRDSDRFSKILYELLRQINYILENPHDYELRTIKSELLKKVLQCEAFADYLKSIGFRPIGENYIYPKENTLSNLRIAQAAIERKIYFCCGSLNRSIAKFKSSHDLSTAGKPKFVAENVLDSKNYLLLKIERLFNDMIKYESEELQELAREHIPLVTLQLMAIDRVREHQVKLKTGEIQGRDLTYDVALMMELLGWFKGSFFSWVDKPACERCGGATAMLRTAALRTPAELCNVELYKCTVCPDGRASFPRHNDVATLLQTRRGRCGEWANCFTLMCRALGYDTRYVYDTTDHVWCEIFDYDSNSWLHADPCEGLLNAPLTYCVGWNKKLSYVIAVSRDDLQDVTWRYTVDHKKVLERRKECGEAELISAILTLRTHRQRQVSEARRRYLARRCLQELVQLMVERKPSDYENHGRISGSREWREQRGEIGLAGHGFVFQFDRPGKCSIKYYTALDTYRISFNGEEKEYKHWNTTVYESRNVFRKHEEDWQMVYLAREEGETSGSISWKLSAASSLALRGLSLRAHGAAFDSGRVQWLLAFDDTDLLPVDIADQPVQFSRECANVTLTAELSGGSGAVAWQHAQLFRQPAAARHSALEIQVHVVSVEQA